MGILDDKEKDDLKEAVNTYIKYDFYKTIIGVIASVVIFIIGVILMIVFVL